MKTLPPAFLARAKAVKAAHAHLAVHHPDWPRLTPQERIRAVHQHLAQPRLVDVMARLRVGRAGV